MSSIIRPAASTSCKATPSWRTLLSLCFVGAAACYSVSASAETWWVRADYMKHDVHVPAGGSHTVRVCATAETMHELYGVPATKELPAVMHLVIQWRLNGDSAILFPTPSFKLPLADNALKLRPDGRYCGSAWTLKSSDFPSAGYYQMYGDLPQASFQKRSHRMYEVDWRVDAPSLRARNAGSGIGTARLAMMGDTRPTFVQPKGGRNFVATNVTLAITSHVASQYCSVGHYEVAWQRALVPDKANGFPGAMQPWLAAPKPNLPCHGATPSTAAVSFAALRSGSRDFHYKYHVRARLVGNGFSGAWSPWREFAVEEPPLRTKPARGLKLQPAAAPSMGTPSGQSSGTTTRKMTVPLRELQIRR